MLMHLQYFFLNDESVEKHDVLAWAGIRKSGFVSFGAHAAGWRGPLASLGLPPLYTMSRGHLLEGGLLKKDPAHCLW